MNLIITCGRHLEDEAATEIIDILKHLGDTNCQITKSSLSGILTGTTSLDPFFVVKQVREKIIKEPWTIRYCLRIIPIQITTITEKKAIVDTISKIQTMKLSDTYRITVEKRNSNISSKELISAIAEKIQNKVSLENFEWIILVEIIGSRTGISILKENDMISVQKIKRSLSE